MGVDYSSHRDLAARLRRRVLETGVVGREFRESALSLGGGGDAAVPEPYEVLARQIGEASYRVTDRQVEAVRDAGGSDKAAFEVVMAASIGAGLHRWDAAVNAIEGAAGASS